VDAGSAQRSSGLLRIIGDYPKFGWSSSGPASNNPFLCWVAFEQQTEIGILEGSAVLAPGVATTGRSALTYPPKAWTGRTVESLACDELPVYAPTYFPMRIDAKEMVCGFPPLEVRRLLRRADGFLSIDFACQVLDVDARTTISLIHELESSGYIEKDPGERGWWRTTVKGSALTMASAALPLRRATADKLLLQFLARVEELRDDHQWCYVVDRAVLFGSYLSTKATLGDVDIGVALRRRHQDAEAHKSAEEHRRKIATDAGRQFINFSARLYWPRTEVGLFLKAKRLSLHEIEVDASIIEAGPHVTVYTDGSVCRAAIPLLGDWSTEKSQKLVRMVSITRELQAAKRKNAALTKKVKEGQDILAQVQTYERMSAEERAHHQDDIEELAVRARRFAAETQPKPTDE
jgi:hypothetical protein